jgi:hypothetical protein
MNGPEKCRLYSYFNHYPTPLCDLLEGRIISDPNGLESLICYKLKIKQVIVIALEIITK